MDVPDNVTAAAASMAAGTLGTANITFTVMITPEEIDQATDIAKKLTAGPPPPG